MTQTDRQIFGYFHFGVCWTPYLSNCITLVKIFFWKHRVNFVHYVLLPTEQAETYLKIYYLTHIYWGESSKKTKDIYGQADRYKNSQLLLTAAAALSQNGQIAV